MILATLNKQPSEILRLDIDYGFWLGAMTLDLATATVAPAGGVSPPIALLVFRGSNRSMAAFIEGGVSGTSYLITIQVTDTDGRLREDEVQLRVKEIAR